MDIIIVLLLIVIGIVFLLLEIFFLPGISIAGIVGVLSSLSAVIYAYTQIGDWAGHLSLIGTILLLALAVWIFLKNRSLEKMSLQAKVDGKVNATATEGVQIGDVGRTLSRLAPMGKVVVQDRVIEAKTDGEFIDADVAVRVLNVNTTNVLVEKIVTK